jgi:hypothetical protein
MANAHGSHALSARQAVMREHAPTRCCSRSSLSGHAPLHRRRRGSQPDLQDDRQGVPGRQVQDLHHPGQDQVHQDAVLRQWGGAAQRCAHATHERPPAMGKTCASSCSRSRGPGRWARSPSDRSYNAQLAERWRRRWRVPLGTPVCTKTSAMKVHVELTNDCARLHKTRLVRSLPCVLRTLFHILSGRVRCYRHIVHPQGPLHQGHQVDRRRRHMVGRIWALCSTWERHDRTVVEMGGGVDAAFEGEQGVPVRPR